VVQNLLPISFSYNTDNDIGTEVIKLSEALKSNSTLTSLNLSGTKLIALFISFSPDTGNNIGTEGGIMLAEALKYNSTLTYLNIIGNRLVGSFHSHTIQVRIRWVMKQPSNY
jgi:hypothetical protein